MCFGGCDHKILLGSLAQIWVMGLNVLPGLNWRVLPASPFSNQMHRNGNKATSIPKVERYITSSIAPLRALSYRNVMSELWYPDGFPLTFCSLWTLTTNVYDAASLYDNRNTALVTFRENPSNHFAHLSFSCSLHTAFIPSSHCLRLHAHPSLILF